MIVKMFKPRFAPLVKNRKKKQTVRPWPKRMPKVGDEISCRQWKGKPYRSKQIHLLTSKVTRVCGIYVDDKGIVMPPGPGSIMAVVGTCALVCLAGFDADRFAMADGFMDWADMWAWFKAEHGLPFEGICIFWD